MRPIARQILLTSELPKARSGQDPAPGLLRDAMENRALGDVTALVDPTVVNAMKDRMGAGPDEESLPRLLRAGPGGRSTDAGPDVLGPGQTPV